jgi:hypothetical protein
MKQTNLRRARARERAGTESNNSERKIEKKNPELGEEDLEPWRRMAAKP